MGRLFGFMDRFVPKRITDYRRECFLSRWLSSLITLWIIMPFIVAGSRHTTVVDIGLSVLLLPAVTWLMVLLVNPITPRRESP